MTIVRAGGTVGMRYAGTLVIAAALLAGACSTDEKPGADAGGGGTGGGGSAGGGGGAGGGAGDGSCTLQTNCGPQHYCEFTPHVCGAGVGRCQMGPLDCIVNEVKVCGCDGNVHRSECDANGAGVDVSDVGGCTPPSGTFACGRYFCTQGSQYCSHNITPSLPTPGTFQCLPLPSACGTTSRCACLPPPIGCTPTCTMSSSGDLTNTCMGT